jgi:hypothetical protein
MLAVMHKFSLISVDLNAIPNDPLQPDVQNLLISSFRSVLNVSCNLLDCSNTRRETTQKITPNVQNFGLNIECKQDYNQV